MLAVVKLADQVAPMAALVADPRIEARVGKVAVNLSLKQLRQASFILRFRSVFRKHAVSPSAALTATRMEVVPHIVIGLHYGRLLGEANALDIVSRYPVEALVLVVVMPFYAAPGLFAVPDSADVGRIFGEARRRLHDRHIQLEIAPPARASPRCGGLRR